MSDHEHTDRDRELRKMLVATAAASPDPAPRRRWSVIAAAIGAFAVAGAITGGAVSAAALNASAATSPLTVDVAAMSGALVHDDTQTFGTPVVLTGQGDTVVDLGPVPEGARQVVVAVHCVDPGTFRLLLDGQQQSSLTCDQTATAYTNGGSFYDVAGPGDHTLEISSDHAERFVVWASWATQAQEPAPSTDQTAALADGTVTETEYRDAFARYKTCMSDAGYAVVFIEDSSTIIRYSTTDAAVSSGAERRCYTAEFQQIDAAWQIAHEYDSETYMAFRACLQAAGVTPVTDAEGVWQQIQDQGIDPVQCTTGGH